MKVTIHALKRYNQRVLNDEKRLDINSFKASIIKRRLIKSIEYRYEQQKLNGYYKVEDDVFALVKENSILTVIKYDLERTFYPVKSFKKLNDKILENDRVNVVRRKNKKIKRTTLKEITLKAKITKESKMIEDTLRKGEEARRKRLEEISKRKKDIFKNIKENINENVDYKCSEEKELKLEINRKLRKQGLKIVKKRETIS